MQKTSPCYPNKGLQLPLLSSGILTLARICTNSQIQVSPQIQELDCESIKVVNDENQDGKLPYRL